jgi:hypothetical protein
MANIVKVVGKHLENASQDNMNMESLWTKIEELDEWINLDNNVPGALLIIKAYDIILHTLATNECQELASKFEEKVKQSLAMVMKFYRDNVQDMKNDIQWLEISL